MATDAAAVEEPRRGTLRRELRFWEAIALSIGIMAPTAAMALNGVGVSASVGRAVPLAMIIATAGVLLVSFAFIRLSRHFSHAGSVYAFSGATLGPRAGFFSGWALLGQHRFWTHSAGAQWRDIVNWINALELSENAILIAFSLAIGVLSALGVVAFYKSIDVAFALFYRLPGELVPKLALFAYRPVLTAAGLALAWWFIPRSIRAPRRIRPDSSCATPCPPIRLRS